MKTTTNKINPTHDLIGQHLTRLQLPYFVQNYPALLTQAANESWSHARFLEQLAAGEVARRNDALIVRRLKAARLPGIKTLEDFDWSYPGRSTAHRYRTYFASSSCPSAPT